MLGTNKRGKENNNRSKPNAKQEEPQHEYYMSLWIPDMLLRCYCGEKQKRRCLFILFGPTVFHCLNVVLFRIQHGSVLRCQSDRLTKTRVCWSALKFFRQKTCILFLLVFDVWVMHVRKYNGYYARLYCQIFAQDNFPPFLCRVHRLDLTLYAQ